MPDGRRHVESPKVETGRILQPAAGEDNGFGQDGVRPHCLETAVLAFGKGLENAVTVWCT